MFLLQLENIVSFRLTSVAQTLLPILIAAVAYPLGNRKMMALCPPKSAPSNASTA
ncbi:MAG: multidrug resistance efflux transporter family protein [Eubacteriales bacterium]